MTHLEEQHLCTLQELEYDEEANDEADIDVAGSFLWVDLFSDDLAGEASNMDASL